MRIRTLLSALYVLVLASAAVSQTLVLQPNTTLTRETGNNTSAADIFGGQPNGNLGAGNISKLPIRSLLYPGATTQVYTHVTPWWGRSGHVNIGYSSQDSEQVKRQVEDMVSRGMDGAIVNWYGPGSYEDLATKLFMQQAEAHPPFGLIVSIDVGAVRWHSCYSSCSATSAAIELASRVSQTFFPSPAYVRQNGRPVLFEFGLETLPQAVDWNAVQNALPEVIWIHRNATGYTRTQSGGAYGWLGSKPPAELTDDYDSSSYLEYFYKIGAKYPNHLTWGSVFKGFNNTLASWATPGGRYVHQLCGQTWLKGFAIINKWYSAGNPLYAMQLTTWNDYEEGTELETGVDNCVSISGQAEDGVLNWSITGQENTIDHYEVFVSEDGENLMSLGQFPAGTRTANLASFGVEGGTYKLYVKAVGKPSIRNQMSAAIVYDAPSQAPVTSLALSASEVVAPAEVTAATASSGEIVATTIDFGDGAVMDGPVAVHTYSNPGTYMVSSKVKDKRGATAAASAPVKVIPPGLFITAPGSGTTSGSPVRVTAHAMSGRKITGMAVYVDDVRKYSISSEMLDAAIPMSGGTHKVVVKSWDSAGAMMQSSVAVTVPNQPPVAVLSLSTNSGIGPLTVSASTAGSRDADGSIAKSRVDFGNGVVLNGPAASYKYTEAGMYAVVATVTDNAGGTATAYGTVNVQPGLQIYSPASGASVGSKVRVAATATASPGRRISAIVIYVDDRRVYRVAGGSLDTYLSLKRGQRRIVVKAWEDVTGMIYSSQLTVTVK